MNDIGAGNLPAEQRPVGTEASKTIEAKHRSGFVARYLSGANILDIGYRGYLHNAVPIVPQAIGIDLEYPGYDGKTLPFENDSQDAVFSSHCLEHIADYKGALREWYRVLRVGGFMVIAVPHQFLYEKRNALPSRWNLDHKRFYTPASLMTEVESALAPNTYRLRHLIDNDLGFTYQAPPEHHSAGSYEIEMVLEKIAPPRWSIIPDLMVVEFGPHSDPISWIGFDAPETGCRWTDGEQASMRFQLSAEQVEAARAANSAVSITADTFGKQRVKAALNAQPVYNKTLEGTGVVLDIPIHHLQQGLNSLDLELPDATRPRSASDRRHPGIAIRSVRFVRTPHKLEVAPAKPERVWNTVLRLFKRS
jgi:SAM-dependent methyltransferase